MARMKFEKYDGLFNKNLYKKKVSSGWVALLVRVSSPYTTYKSQLMNA